MNNNDDDFFGEEDTDYERLNSLREYDDYFVSLEIDIFPLVDESLNDVELSTSEEEEYYHYQQALKSEKLKALSLACQAADIQQIRTLLPTCLDFLDRPAILECFKSLYYREHVCYEGIHVFIEHQVPIITLSTRSEWRKLLLLLKKNSPDSITQDSLGKQQFLQQAIRYQQYSLANSLIQKGFNINKVDFDFFYPPLKESLNHDLSISDLEKNQFYYFEQHVENKNQFYLQVLASSHPQFYQFVNNRFLLYQL